MFEIKYNCSYFSCYLLPKLSEIIVENKSITLFRVTTVNADIFYPIFTQTITILVCFIREKKAKLFRRFAPTHSPRHWPGPHVGLTACPRHSASIVFGFSKNWCTHIFSVLSPDHMWYLWSLLTPPGTADFLKTEAIMVFVFLFR